MNYGTLYSSFFTIHDIYAQRQEGRDGSLFEMSNPRPTDAFLLFTESTAIYTQNENELLYVPNGALVYIPKGSIYTVVNHCVDKEGKVKVILFEFSLKKAENVGIISKRSNFVPEARSEESFSYGADRITIVDFRPKLYERLFNALVDAYNDYLSKKAAAISVHRVAYGIFDLLIKNRHSPSDISNNSVIDIAMNYLANIGYGEKSISEIASACCVSVSSLEKTFIKVLGISPVRYRNECKILKAKNLLLEENLTVSEISDILGFCDSAHFCKAFKNAMGVTPSEFRKGR